MGYDPKIWTPNELWNLLKIKQFVIVSLNKKFYLKCYIHVTL
jgi:hypothetical protein